MLASKNKMFFKINALSYFSATLTATIWAKQLELARF